MPRWRSSPRGLTCCRWCWAKASADLAEDRTAGVNDTSAVSRAHFPGVPAPVFESDEGCFSPAVSWAPRATSYRAKPPPALEIASARRHRSDGAHPPIGIRIPVLGLIEVTELGVRHRHEKARDRVRAAELHAPLEVTDCTREVVRLVSHHPERSQEVGILWFTRKAYSTFPRAIALMRRPHRSP